MEPFESNELTEMRENLRKLYQQDPEAAFLAGFWRHVSDPVKPCDQNRRFRPHPLLVLLIPIGGIALALFLYFGYTHP